jgi:hypothetical protein
MDLKARAPQSPTASEALAALAANQWSDGGAHRTACPGSLIARRFDSRRAELSSLSFALGRRSEWVKPRATTKRIMERRAEMAQAIVTHFQGRFGHIAFPGA